MPNYATLGVVCPVALWAGSSQYLPPTAYKNSYIAACDETHKDELMANWTLAMEEQPLYKIDPLR